jgi:transposase
MPEVKWRMIDIMDKHAIIKLKKEGKSNRSVEALIGIDRKTVSKYWNEYQQNINQLSTAESAAVAEIQEAIVSHPSYDASNRNSRKHSQEIDKQLDAILEGERMKDRLLGPHKQKLTKKQIHGILVKAGHDIGYTTVTLRINEKLEKHKECFIRQSYNLGDRLEYDFGEVKFVIDGKPETLHMAVLSSPAADSRWAYIYRNQKKQAFMDSHVQFFEMMRGAHGEVVYDNMKNVVKKFIGKNEKELNDDLVKMSMYYGFDINVTNCFRGNEKGHVEGSVKILRNQIFAPEYVFSSFKEVKEYLHNELVKLNESSLMEEEKKHLLPYRPKLELADITINKVNKYAFIQVENNSYSVPDYLVGRSVSVKSYYDRLLIYSNNSIVCEHEKIDGDDGIRINIYHYLDSLIRKPGALKNSLALKSVPELKNIYDRYFTANPKKFIKLLGENQGRTLEDTIENLKSHALISTAGVPTEVIPAENQLNRNTKLQTGMYDKLCVGRENSNAN